MSGEGHLVYVSGPYTAPTEEGRENNVAAAMEAGRELLDAGIYPLIPHLNHLYSRHFERKGLEKMGHQDYLAWDKVIEVRCDGLLKLADSPGADEEERVAIEHHIPVFYSAQAVVHWFACEYCQHTYPEGFGGKIEAIGGWDELRPMPVGAAV